MDWHRHQARPVLQIHRVFLRNAAMVEKVALPCDTYLYRKRVGENVNKKKKHTWVNRWRISTLLTLPEDHEHDFRIYCSLRTSVRSRNKNLVKGPSLVSMPVLIYIYISIYTYICLCFASKTMEHPHVEAGQFPRSIPIESGKEIPYKSELEWQNHRTKCWKLSCKPCLIAVWLHHLGSPKPFSPSPIQNQRFAFFHSTHLVAQPEHPHVSQSTSWPLADIQNIRRSTAG